MSEISVPGISVVIPTYEGKEILKKYFPGQKKHVDSYVGNTEIIVVDDCSRDDSVDWLEKNYPATRILSLSSHRGFGAACNLGVSSAKYNIVFLINNDMELTENTLLKCASWFEDPSLFGVRLGILLASEKNKNLDLNMFLLGLKIYRGYFELPKLKRENNFGPCEFPALSGGEYAKPIN